MKQYLLEENNYKHVKDTQYDLAVIPWGATEAHNYHLPYGTDSYETRAFAENAAGICWNKGIKCAVLPAIPFGVNTGQFDIPGTINIYPSTQAIFLHDILESIQRWGMKKVIVLNGHGGNDFKQIIRELGSKFTDLFLASSNWFQAVDKSIFFENEGDHADEMETSLLLFLENDLVLPLKDAGPGAQREIKSLALKEKWNWFERRWTKITDDTGIGNPSKATAEKGKLYFDAVTEKLVQLFSELANLDLENPYE